MKITLNYHTNEDYRSSCSYTVRDKDGTVLTSLCCYDGEPEDNNLSRNFSDFTILRGILEIVNEAGLRGQVVEWEFTEEEE